METFRNRPQIFGLPLLFPPNRIEDGRYAFEDRVYQYPITIEKENNYHHGILKSQPFIVSKAEENDKEVKIECRYYSNAANDAVYKHFPHEFKCKIVYRLSDKGLEQEVVFTNKSREAMPVGVGFHTPLMIPFEGGEGSEYRLRVAVDEQCELSPRNLPTGKTLPLDEQFAKLRGEGLQTTDCAPIEAGFTLREIEVDGKKFRGAVVEHLTTGRKVFYEVDDETRYWTIWNNGGNQPYCCPSPSRGSRTLRTPPTPRRPDSGPSNPARAGRPPTGSTSNRPTEPYGLSDESRTAHIIIHDYRVSPLSCRAEGASALQSITASISFGARMDVGVQTLSCPSQRPANRYNFERTLNGKRSDAS